MKQKHIKLKNQILLLLCVGVCGMILLSISSLISFFSLQEQALQADHELFAKQMASSLERNYTGLRSIATSLAYDQSLQAFLLSDAPQDTYVSYQRANAQLINAKNLNLNITDIALVGKNGNYANTTGDAALYQSLYREIIAAPMQDAYFFSQQALIMDAQSIACHVLALPMYQLTLTSNNFLGMLFIAVQPQSLLNEDIIVTTSTPVELLMVGLDGGLIWGNDAAFKAVTQTQQTFAENTPSLLEIDGVSYQCRAFSIESAACTLYTLVSLNGLRQQVQQQGLRQFLLIAIFCFAFAIIGFVVYRTLQRSLQQLNTILQRISKGGHSGQKERIAVEQNFLVCEEFATIAHSFNEMMDETRALTVDILEKQGKMYELEMCNKQTEIAFLQSQINPHFLYNTLTLICGMASLQEHEGVISIASALSQLYRYAAKADDMVQLQTELEIVQSYLKIQSTRFEDRFTVSYHVDPAALHTQMPKMILQPLVENAIIHGLEPCLTPEHLEISAHLKSERHVLEIAICDTGRGIEPARLAELQASLQSTLGRLSHGYATAQTVRSVGLSNVYNRLYLYYGPSGLPHIRSAPDEGTTITFCIPTFAED